MLKTAFKCLHIERAFKPLVQMHAKAYSQQSQGNVSDFFDLNPVEELRAEAPKGNSANFHQKYLDMTALVADGLESPNALKQLGKAVETETDLIVFKSFLAKWNTSQIQLGPKDARSLTGLFCKLKMYDHVIGILFDKRKYGLLPLDKDLAHMLRHYHSECMNTTSIPHRNHSLDQMYRTFSIILAYDLEPTLDHYELLIEASLLGKRHYWRAVATLDETKSFGWNVSPELAARVEAIREVAYEYSSRAYWAKKSLAKESIIEEPSVDEPTK